MASAHRDSAIPTTVRLPGWAAVAMLATACGSLPGPVELSPSGPPSAPAAEAEASAKAGVEPGEFVVPARRIDTWNAVGQILVQLDGVTYQGRSQMLGIYAVRYRGEEFLIETRGQVIDSPSEQVSTRVSAILPDGQRHDSKAVTELLGLLQQQLPAELARLAADENYQKLLAQ